MKIRKHSNFEKPDEWKDFIRDMDLWIMVYDALSYLAKHKIMGTLALKAHVQNSEEAYSRILNERELLFFREIVSAKRKDYDPDLELQSLEGQVVCVELNPSSHLAERFSSATICGKYLGLNKGKAFTRLKNRENNYEEREAAFSFRIAYPDADNFADVSLLDLVNLELFL